MKSPYLDAALGKHYLDRLVLSDAEYTSSKQSQLEEAKLDSFFESVVKQTYSFLQNKSPKQLPRLYFNTWHGEQGELARIDADSIFTDKNGIHIGLNFIAYLDGAISVLSAYLKENYLWQITPPEINLPIDGDGSGQEEFIHLSFYRGDLRSIYKTVSIDEFPAKALSFYSDHLASKTEIKDGYKKPSMQVMMEYLQEAYLISHHSDDSERRVFPVLPKCLVDLRDFIEGFDAESLIEAYHDSLEGPYLLELHLQLLLDALFFILAHEIAHFDLGHVQRRKTSLEQIRKEETVADETALDMLRDIPQFQSRSLVIIFNFARSMDSDDSPDRIDHPLSHNRMLILSQILFNESGSDSALRNDINAGLALLPSQLQPQYLTFGWPNTSPEDVDLLISSYSDLNYTSHVMVYIDRKPLSTEPDEAFSENAFLLAHLAYKIEFEVRDRISAKVHTWGGAGYHPNIRPENMYTSIRDGSVFSRLSFSIPAPPEFCLRWPEAEFVIKNVEVMCIQPNFVSSEEPKSIRFFYEPMELDINDVLQNTLSLKEDAASYSRLLLAAQRYTEYTKYLESRKIYRWLYEQDAEFLPYSDLLSFSAQELEAGQFEDAKNVAEFAIRSRCVQRPGFHMILARVYVEQGKIENAFEEAFLEMALFGQYGEYFDDAKNQFDYLALLSEDNMVSKAMRRFAKHRDEGNDALLQGFTKQALECFQEGKNVITNIQNETNDVFVFLRQLQADVTFEIGKLQENYFEEAVEASEAVLKLWDNFVPALMLKAKINLLKGNRELAYGLWKRAHEIEPFNSIVFDAREEFEYGLH